jgi:hypothetical protein
MAYRGYGYNYGYGEPWGGIEPPVLVNLPTGFSIASPYRPNVFRIGSGVSSTFTTDYDLTARKALITPAQTIYIDPVGGSNNNNGLSEGQAIRSLDLFVRMSNAFGTPTRGVYAAAPLSSPRIRYLRTATQARTGGVLVNGVNLDATYTDCWSTYVPVVDLIIEPSVAGGVADTCIDAGALTFSTTADANIYSHPAAANRSVVDYSNLDDKGCPIRLAELPTAPANVNAPWPELNALWTLYSNLPKRGGGTYNTGVCYRNASTMFIRTWDNRNLIGDTQIVEGPGSIAGPILRANTASGANRRYVVEGLGFLGGNDGALTIRGDNTFLAFADLVRCRMFASVGGRGGLNMQPTAGTGAHIIAVDCAANGNANDGFNVSGTVSLITINCIGDWNGWNTNNTNNGYTFHDASVGIDVMGSYRNNQDRSVHHVHDGRNWHLGLEPGTRRGADATDISMAFAINGAGNTGTRIVWLDAPRIFNGPNGAPQHAYGVWPGSVLNYANAAVTPVSGASGWTGTIQFYTP